MQNPTDPNVDRQDSVPGLLQGSYTYAKASNTDASDNFGAAVAVDGDTMVVAATGEDGNGSSESDNSTGAAGAVYVYRWSGTAWGQDAYIKGPNAGVYDSFGWSVALDGDVLAVGAPDESSGTGDQADDSALSAGAVYIYRRTGSQWNFEAYIKPQVIDEYDQFGRSVALEGDVLVAGAPGESSQYGGIDNNPNDNSLLDAGAAYVFRHANGQWSQEAYIKASHPSYIGDFGRSVAVKNGFVTVGAPLHKVSGSSLGAVYVFEKIFSGWRQLSYILAPNGEHQDEFGRAVTLSEDASVLVAGARYEDSAATGINGDQNDNSATQAGAAYIYGWNGFSYALQAYAKASNTGAGDQFGSAVAASGDYVAVGAWLEDSAATGINGNQADNSAAGSGAVYLYQRSGSAWSQAAYIKASNTGGNDRFGDAVALDSVAGALLVGAWAEDSNATGIGGNQADNSASGAGAAYLIE